MNIKTTFLAVLMAFIPFFAVQAESHDHKLAAVVLNEENASFMIISGENGVRVTTFGYKEPTETCKFLIQKGVNVKTVTNYKSDDKTDDFWSYSADC